MLPELDKPQVGDKVVLIAVPPGLFADLPDEDQRAISAIVGKPAQLLGWEEGRAVLDFSDDARSGHHHTIWAAPEFIARHRE